MRIAHHVSELIGNTPLVQLNSVVPAGAGLVAAKVEYLNPGGSSKDRIAIKMIDAAEEAGLLGPGGTIVEPTSGNTGVGLAIVAQQRGYKCIFVCPDKVSEDKRNVLRAYGAEVVVCPTAVAPDHPDSYYSVSNRLTTEIEGAWKPDQYSNPNGPASHYETTGPEIWADTEGKVTHFVAGVGTGGTITGTGRYLKEISGGKVKVIGADPEGSVYSGGTGRPYLVEGVGEDARLRAGPPVHAPPATVTAPTANPHASHVPSLQAVLERAVPASAPVPVSGAAAPSGDDVKTKLANVTALAALGIKQKAWMLADPAPSADKPGAGAVAAAAQPTDTQPMDAAAPGTDDHHPLAAFHALPSSTPLTDAELHAQYAARAIVPIDLITLMEAEPALRRSRLLAALYDTLPRENREYSAPRADQ